MKPLLLLDVDGAVSADAMGAPEANGYIEHRTPAGRAVLSEHVNRQLVSLSSTFEPVWCTGWNERANEHLSPLIGCGTLPVCDLTDARAAYDRSRYDGTFVPFPQRTWKLEAIQAYVADRAFALVDDQVGQDLIAWCRARTAPSLLVSVSATRGITDDEFEMLRRWAAAPAPAMIFYGGGRVLDRS